MYVVLGQQGFGVRSSLHHQPIGSSKNISLLSIIQRSRPNNKVGHSGKLTINDTFFSVYQQLGNDHFMQTESFFFVSC